MSRRKIKSKVEFKRRDLKLEELKGILDKAKLGALSEEEHEKLSTAVDTLAFLTAEIEAQGASIQRLRHLIFGPKTEKTSAVVGDQGKEIGSSAKGDKEETTAESTKVSQDNEDEKKDEEKKDKEKRKGHGRNGASEYRGAEKIVVPHELLKSGDPCPKCEDGKVYTQQEPAVIVRVQGMAPLYAMLYELERLRCNLCGEVFTAKAPEGIGAEKYDESAASMIAMLKYGCGMPFNRLERLEKGLGIPLPSSTQWEVVASAAEKLTPAYAELVRQAAQGKVLHNDDTGAKILELCGQSPKAAMADADKDKNERTGVYTTGIVSVHESHKIALFFTGQKHAGENLELLLAKRAEELGPPIQMCDMLSHNTAGDFETIVGGCLAHSRRRYVEVAQNFPDEVKYVLDELKEIYKNDDVAKKETMTDEQRLAFHQAESGPVMERLRKWLDEQIEEKKVEPNSGIGQAIEFMQKHWNKLTLFLRVAGAPIDNNIVERSLKKAILHRKNAMFFKTQNGARVGDLYMSFIHTAELNDADAFDYVMTLLRHVDQVERNPADWMPWNYKKPLAKPPPPLT